MAHEMGQASFDANSRHVELSCLTCKSLVSGRARDGLDGTDAIMDVLETHSVLSDAPVQLGVTYGGRKVRETYE